MTIGLSFGMSTPRRRGILDLKEPRTNSKNQGNGTNTWFLEFPPLPLALLVPGVGANHIDAALAAHDFAVLADFLDAGSDFHRTPGGLGSLLEARSVREGKHSRPPRLRACASL